jgi:7-keto-8-aminopelargonate synthetase-like enzyme
MNSIYKINTLILPTLTVALALASGCASGPDRVEEDFGNSVRAMRQAQTMDAVAAAAPDTTPITSTDGQRMENALQSYRENVGNPAAIKDNFDFEVSD